MSDFFGDRVGFFKKHEHLLLYKAFASILISQDVEGWSECERPGKLRASLLLNPILRVDDPPGPRSWRGPSTSHLMTGKSFIVLKVSSQQSLKKYLSHGLSTDFTQGSNLAETVFFLFFFPKWTL